MSTPSGFDLWYPCYDDVPQAFFDEIVSAWVFGGQNTFSRLVFDSAAAAIGLSPGSVLYENLLRTVPVSISPSGSSPYDPAAVVTVPVGWLNAVAPRWLEFLDSPFPCKMLDPRSMET